MLYFLFEKLELVANKFFARIPFLDPLPLNRSLFKMKDQNIAKTCQNTNFSGFEKNKTFKIRKSNSENSILNSFKISYCRMYLKHLAFKLMVINVVVIFDRLRIERLEGR